MSPCTTKFTTSSLPDLTSKIYIVTGGNTGIGYGTVSALASKNAKVYMCARNPTKANSAITSLKKEIPNANIELLVMDHCDLSSVAAAAKQFLSKEERLHGLVNNAGVMFLPYEITKDGYEIQWQTNYIAHWLFTRLLTPIILKTAAEGKPGDVRIVDVTSGGHSTFSIKQGINFDDFALEDESVTTRYGVSKLGNILQAREMSKRYGPNRKDKSGFNRAGRLEALSKGGGVGGAVGGCNATALMVSCD